MYFQSSARHFYQYRSITLVNESTRYIQPSSDLSYTTPID